MKAGIDAEEQVSAKALYQKLADLRKIWQWKEGQYEHKKSMEE